MAKPLPSRQIFVIYIKKESYKIFRVRLYSNQERKLPHRQIPSKGEQNHRPFSSPRHAQIYCLQLAHGFLETLSRQLTISMNVNHLHLRFFSFSNHESFLIQPLILILSLTSTAYRPPRHRSGANHNELKFGIQIPSHSRFRMIIFLMEKNHHPSTSVILLLHVPFFSLPSI